MSATGLPTPQRRTIARMAAAACALWLAWFVAPAALAQPRQPTSPPPPPHDMPFGVTTGDARRDCATCHTEWVDSFNRPGAVLLIDKPTHKLVAESETCLGCHDGSVGDSRRMVWLDHGHQAKRDVPANIHVPDNLPLVNGKIDCRTCHTAHATKRPEGPEALADTFFLRMPNDTGQLCQACHTDHPKGQEHGSHPLGPMKAKLPDNLRLAGSHGGRDNQTVVCQSCHTPHGSRTDHLLVMGTESSQLCVSCHNQLQPGQWTAPANGQPPPGHEHLQNFPLRTPERKQAIRAMGTKVGANDTMVCLSCHKLHEGKPGTAELADTLTDSTLCLRCHADRADMTGTKHDLRKTAPLSLNVKKQTPEQSGQCGACHSFHSFARVPEPTKADPTGLCTSCHGTGHLAEKAGGLAMGHPTSIDVKKLESIAPGAKPVLFRGVGQGADAASVMCLTCHDPHQTKHEHFLRESKDQLCGSCHGRELRSLAGAHDMTRSPKLLNALNRPAADTGKCGFCHSIHEGGGEVMWAATKQPPRRPDDLCVSCHQPNGLAAAKPAPLLSHPTGPEVTPKTKLTSMSPVGANLPLFDREGHRAATGFMACSSCHDPHADAGRTRSLLRVDGPPSATCVQCHGEKGQLAGSPHDGRTKPTAWPTTAPANGTPAGATAADADLCMSCHRAHGNASKSGLWAVPPSVTASKRASPADRVCLACHKENDWGSRDLPSALLASAAPTTAPATRPSAIPQGGAPSAEALASGLPPGTDLSEYFGGAAGGAAAASGPTTGPTVAPAPGSRPPKGRMLHPQTMPSTGPIAAAAGKALPLAHGDPHDPGADRLMCKTCHDPHAAAKTAALLRTPSRLAAGTHVSPTETADACVTCHADARTLAHSMHAPALMPKGVAGATACGACHAPHATGTSVAQKLWARAGAAGPGPRDAAERCLSCHDGTTVRAPKTIVQHPQSGQAVVDLIRSTKAARLAWAQDQRIPDDRVTCVTCHLPHGKEMPQTRALPTAGQAAPDPLARSAAKPMLRSDVSGQFCASCHGPQAPRLFLYYHHPEKRVGLSKMEGVPGRGR